MQPAGEGWQQSGRELAPLFCERRQGRGPVDDVGCAPARGLRHGVLSESGFISPAARARRIEDAPKTRRRRRAGVAAAHGRAARARRRRATHGRAVQGEATQGSAYGDA
jgi:hypothetical protein